MHSTTSDNISCLIFGHNYYKPKKSNKNEDQLVCKNCKTQIEVDYHGNFDTSATKDKAFETSLRKLFLLRRQLSI